MMLCQRAESLEKQINLGSEHRDLLPKLMEIAVSTAYP